LWRGSEQMTLTEPLRRITLQLRQIFFTEARTFIVDSSFQGERVLPVPSIALEIGFLHQRFILMRHQVRLNLRHEIHHHDYNNQQ